MFTNLTYTFLFKKQKGNKQTRQKNKWKKLSDFLKTHQAKKKKHFRATGCIKPMQMR